MLFVFLAVLMYMLHITAKNCFATVCTCIKLTYLEGKYHYHTLKNRLTGTYHIYIESLEKLSTPTVIVILLRSKKKNV